MTKTFCDRCGSDITDIPDFSMRLESYDEDGDVIDSTEYDLCETCKEIVLVAVMPTRDAAARPGRKA